MSVRAARHRVARRRTPESRRVAGLQATAQVFAAHTRPTFRVRDKTFVMYVVDDQGDGLPAIWCEAFPGARAVLVGSDPDRFFCHRTSDATAGCVGRGLDWDLLKDLITDSCRMTAPKRVLKLPES